MNKFILIAIVFATIAELSFGGFFGFMDNNPDFQKISQTMCKEPKLDDNQWSKFLECFKCNETKPENPKMKSDFENCVKVADDVNANLKETDMNRMKYVYGFCSVKFNNCQKDQMKKWKESNNNNKQDQPKPDMKVIRDKWNQKLTCAKGVLGIQ